MSSEDMISTLEDGVRILRINRPKTKNAFNSVIYSTITNTLNADAKDDNVVVTILTGNGDYYSSGFDIKDAMANAHQGDSLLREMLIAFINYPKILISLVNGPAIGISVTTAALCDIVYATDKATFETPFLKLGLCAEGCSSYTFPRILGRSKASEILLLGRKITAQEAYQFGFVAQVIPHNQLNEFLNNLKQYGKLSVNCAKINKKLIMDNYRDLLHECNKRELAQLRQCTESEEFSKAILKFMSKKSKL